MLLCLFNVLLSHNALWCMFVLAVVEQVDSSASLYGKSIQGHHVCLLVKRLVCTSLDIKLIQLDTYLVTDIYLAVCYDTHRLVPHWVVISTVSVSLLVTHWVVIRTVNDDREVTVVVVVTYWVVIRAVSIGVLVSYWVVTQSVVSLSHTLMLLPQLSCIDCWEFEMHFIDCGNEWSNVYPLPELPVCMSFLCVYPLLELPVCMSTAWVICVCIHCLRYLCVCVDCQL